MGETWFFDEELVELRERWVAAVSALRLDPRDTELRQRVHVASRQYFARVSTLRSRDTHDHRPG